jgi:hypothetical protein
MMIVAHASGAGGRADRLGPRQPSQPGRGADRAGAKAGHATVWLEGSKLRGGYALTRIGGMERAGQPAEGERGKHEAEIAKRDVV